MSGILGLFNTDGRPVRADELCSMASLLERRGPERTGTWRSSEIGLGQTLLATTPEARFEHLPLEHSQSGCAITGDLRLDNRSELLGDLGIASRAPAIGDGELALSAYLQWGDAFVGHLLGDFAWRSGTLDSGS